MRLEAIATPARHSTADYPQQHKLAEVHNIIIIFDIFCFAHVIGIPSVVSPLNVFKNLVGGSPPPRLIDYNFLFRSAETIK